MLLKMLISIARLGQGKFGKVLSARTVRSIQWTYLLVYNKIYVDLFLYQSLQACLLPHVTGQSPIQF